MKVFQTSLLNQLSVELDFSVKLVVMLNLNVPLAISMLHLDQLNVLSAQLKSSVQLKDYLWPAPVLIISIVNKEVQILSIVLRANIKMGINA